MGPSQTGYKDAPLRLASSKPNTTTGKFYVMKGRVQLEKPAGVDAISGDVYVGGQGFNDCLFWINSDQIKDSAKIVLLESPDSGAAYLGLNGCSEKAESLSITSRNVIKTDDGEKHGKLMVRSLTIDGKPKPADTYTAETEKWIEGGGKVVVNNSK